MSAKTILVHRNCGTRTAEHGSYCPACRKWLVGDATVRVKVRKKDKR